MTFQQDDDAPKRKKLPIDMRCASRDNNDTRTRFVEEFCKDQSPAHAFMRAGYAPRNMNDAQHDAEILLALPQIQEAIEYRTRNLIRIAEVTEDRIVLELARIAFSDQRKLLERVEARADDGSLHKVDVIRDVSDLDEDTARAIESFDYSGPGRKVKMSPKLPALMALARIKGLIDDDSEYKKKSKNVGGTSGISPALDRLTDAQVREIANLAKVTRAAAYNEAPTQPIEADEVIDPKPNNLAALSVLTVKVV